MQGIGDEVMLEEPQDEEEADEVLPSMPTFSAQMKAIAVLRQMLYATDEAPSRILQCLRVLHASICQKRALKARQTTIDTLFR